MSLYEPFTLYHLEAVRRRKPDWVVEDLIMSGDQVILSGAPKSYKSFLASHFAMVLATGFENFLSWKIPKARKVLYISLEMTAEQTAERVSKQLKALSQLPKRATEAEIPKDPEALATFLAESTRQRREHLKSIPLIHVFSVNGRHSVDILDDEQKDGPRPGSWANLHRIISEVDPEVVIFDSFVRFFSGDENSNPVMSKVMQRMRKLCLLPKPPIGHPPPPVPLPDRYRTSIIIHHNRKESQGFERSYSAAMMRGASAIHSEADLIISTFLVNKETQVSMNFSARKIRAPEFKIIELDSETLLMREAARFDKTEAATPINVQRIPYILDVLEKAVANSEYLSWPDIQRRVEETIGSPDEGLSNAAELYSKTFKEAFAEILDESKRKYRLKDGHDRQAAEAKLKSFFTDKALRVGGREKRKRN